MRSLTRRQDTETEDRERAQRKRKRQKKERRQRKIVAHYLTEIARSEERYADLFGESDSDIDSDVGTNQGTGDDSPNTHGSVLTGTSLGGTGSTGGSTTILGTGATSATNTLLAWNTVTARNTDGSDDEADSHPASVLGRFVSGMANSVYGLGQEMMTSEAAPPSLSSAIDELGASTRTTDEDLGERSTWNDSVELNGKDADGSL